MKVTKYSFKNVTNATFNTAIYDSGIVFAVIGGYGSTVFAFTKNSTDVQLTNIAGYNVNGIISIGATDTTVTFSTTYPSSFMITNIN